MQIGQYEIKNRIFLAPMAGITDQPFRRLCSQLGAGLTFSEMMSTNPDVWHTEKSRLRLAHHEEIGINAVQIAGSDPFEMAEAAKVNVEYGADIIDINMGCPAKKVNKKMAGSALLREPELVAQILDTVVNAVDVPVTLKIRTGWDPENRNCLTIAKIAEQAGIKALTIHGRTRSCLFNGVAEYESIKAVKQAVSIPIIANGDIISAEKAKSVLDYTNADAVMIGRGSFGNPWLFKEINDFFETGQYSTLPENEKYQLMFKHIEDLHQFYGEDKGYRIARKHVGWYVEQLQPESNFKRTFNTLSSTKEQLNALEDFVKSIR
ncbi:tRNA dihydrouridine synthase DusB [Mannheimia varigena]|uniref:tRNA-dihydrouridine synthase B n=1 Tax=Mannheimia varigena USDA-ARS-USMARC-1296 TaxID=1433287 RepID=W0Q9Y0_9PAST|nr:tRNA dihydrouridine synthase DusB [Mannheimia varigena]AHG75107.1 tRNA-dihydrouridine synthase B [Mannheimia varigena USDA-ARS-USMARC-1296]AHG80107.1 tRNA-dihydrouridine synthase B [Mannheimia varigena USDA-ARS-USMARC-1388]AWW34300.1 tRNA dihydrouridine synthase DusB [Mannheimia varigena]QLB17772.1 tRNA dihydrouridine synthase DusB [Mannheimia varigena]TLU75235.1 tRNA dihydrouridine synthase DusB [Mannheimia varigena]